MKSCTLFWSDLPWGMAVKNKRKPFLWALESEWNISIAYFPVTRTVRPGSDIWPQYLPILSFFSFVNFWIIKTTNKRKKIVTFEIHSSDLLSLAEHKINRSSNFKNFCSTPRQRNLTDLKLLIFKFINTWLLTSTLVFLNVLSQNDFCVTTSIVVNVIFTLTCTGHHIPHQNREKRWPLLFLVG